MRSNTATSEFFVGLPDLGKPYQKTLIECSLSNQSPNIRKGKTGSPLYLMPTFRVGFQAIRINPGDG